MEEQKEIWSIEIKEYDNGLSICSYYKGQSFPGMGNAFVNGVSIGTMEVIDIVQPFIGKDVYDVIFNDGSVKRFQKYVSIQFSNRPRTPDSKKWSLKNLFQSQTQQEKK